MKSTLTILGLLLILVACQPQVNQKAESILYENLSSKKYFELRSNYEKYQNEISEKLSLEAQAYLFNTFNKNKASNQAIEKLLLKFGEQLSDSSKANILLTKADNYLKLFQYRKALEANTLILSSYKNAIDSSLIADIDNMNQIYGPLVNVAPQQVIINDENSIPIKRNVVNLMNVEVEIKENRYDFIFDTGAGMSVIKQSFAEELGLAIYETSIDVNSATGIVVKSSLAVIDTLKLGNILVLNSVFLVLEDAMLEFPQANFFPLAAIGFPIMEEFNEFTITKTDTLIIPKHTTPSMLANMRLNGLSPVVNLFNGSDTLEFAFDTGAKTSHFTSKYFEKYKTETVKNAKADSVTTSSGGGSKKHASYLVDSTRLFIGERQAVLKNIHIHTDLNKTFEDVYGNLGQDLIRQFDRMTLNFEDMYVEFK